MLVTSRRHLKNIYEINTAVYLDRLSRQFGKSITLATIPDDELARIASYGMDAVWLMGIWQRSPMAADIASHDKRLVEEIRGILPDFRPTDIIGSAYAVKAYTIDKTFGNEEQLASLRERLRTHGLKLILDLVPNHTAFDHEWISSHPGYYIQGNSRSNSRHPSWYKQYGTKFIAHGRDPHFEPWPDVAQLNAFSHAYRQASIDTLTHIASLCDGVRCDMAMLMMTDIFRKTWGKAAGTPPTREYWQEIISAVRRNFETFTFIAECYWDTQAALIEQGFDYCYDKDLYDRLVVNDIAGTETHLDAVSGIADHLVHFLENHDEPRAAAVFDVELHKAAIHYVTHLSGMKLWHDGQFEGYRIKLPVHVGRGPIEPRDDTIYDYYRHELQV